MNASLHSIHKWLQPWRAIFVEFCDNSNIHGIRYLTERFLHWSERLCWIIVLGVSLWLCGSAAHNNWIEWHDSPMALSFTKQPVSITDIPFPTVTICPEIKTKKTAFDLMSTLEKSIASLTQFERKSLCALAHVCPRLSNNLQIKENFTDESFYDTMKQIALQYDDTFITWIDFLFYSYGSVVQIFTEEGICYTFNHLNSHDIYTDEMAPGMMMVTNNMNASNWSLEKDFQNKSIASKFPVHEVRSGQSSGFVARLKSHLTYFGYECKATDQGFKMILTTPGDALKFSANSFRIPLEERTTILIKPKLTITSDGLRKYTPSQRQCFFDTERQLRFFRIYSQSNCEEECLANATKIDCGCVKFSMPRDKRTQICGDAKIVCYKTTTKRLSSKESTELRDKCNCLPSCTSIDYEADIDRVFFNIENNKNAVRFYLPDVKFSPIQATRLEVRFKSPKVQVVERIESNTLSDFLAFCGGLLGVFLGISALSIVELIYYSTFRFYRIIRPVESPKAVIAFHRRSSNILNRCQFIRGVRAFFVDFCDNSSIHGVLYFTRRGLHWIERLWWVIAFGLSVWLCSTMVHKVWLECCENPVRMQFTRKERSISEVPFPTVTICPDIKTMKHIIDLNKLWFQSSNTDYKIQSLRDNELVKAVFHICPQMQTQTQTQTHRQNGKYITSTFPANESEHIYQILQDFALQFDDVASKCIWQSRTVNCSMYFARILTEDGLCFTFNSLNSHEIYTDEMAPGMTIVKHNSNVMNWSLENGYENRMTEMNYPLRVYESGRGAALEILLDIYEKEFEFFCGNGLQGFRITMNAPGKNIVIREDSFYVPLLEVSEINIRPKLITTAQGLRKYDPNHRKCFFNSERKLRFYKMYTQNNCYEECVANFTKSECGCVKFSQPRDRDTPICGVGSVFCYLLAKINVEIHMIAGNELVRKHYEACNCLPSCTSIEYNAAIDRVKSNKLADGVARIQQSKLVIFFQDQLLDTEQREELYTITDLLSICGGLLGLFMGISTLSIIEILYYSSLRWYWVLRRLASERN